MAIFNPSKQYAFIDADGLIRSIAGIELTDRGPWSSAEFYNRYSVVAYQTSLYVALRPVSVYAPTAIYDENWSSLVDISEGPSDLTLEEVYVLALGANTSAGSALQTAWTGTQLAHTALQTAWTGTAAAAQANTVAFGALQTAWTGTTLAKQSGSLAYTALQTAWTGTSSAASAYTLAADAYALAASSGSYAGTAAYAALQTAWTGTVLAEQALQTAWAGTAEAAAAYVVAVAGTAAAAAAIILANEAKVLAEAGTILPALNDLTDVNVPAPTAQQVLAYDGSEWVAVDAPSTVAPQALTYYLDDTLSGTLAYHRLSAVPEGGPEEADSVGASTSTGPAYIDGYLSDALNRTRLDAGLWEFNTFASVSDGARPVRFSTDILKRSNAGETTYLFSGTSDLVSSTTPVMMAYVSVQGSYEVAPTDKLVAHYWALPTTVLSVTASVYHNGTAHYSHIHTPLSVAHNDLSGLQGGAAGEYYHATADQAEALVGVGGAPSGANPYVTDADTRLATAIAAYSLAQEAYTVALAGTQSGTYSGTLAQQAHDLAQAAYALAAIGTNVGTNAYALAGAAQDTANSAYAVAVAGTNLGAGAYALAAEGQATAVAAYAIALAGTNAAAAAGALAAIGTNVGTNAYNQAVAAENLAVTALATAAPAQFGITVDNGDSVVTTGVKGYIRIPQAMVVTGWAVYANAAGSCVFDVWKTNLAGYPPTVANTITGAAKPTLGGLAANEGVVSGSSGWTREIAAGDYVGFNVDSAATVTRAHLAVFGTH